MDILYRSSGFLEPKYVLFSFIFPSLTMSVPDEDYSRNSSMHIRRIAMSLLCTYGETINNNELVFCKSLFVIILFFLAVRLSVFLCIGPIYPFDIYPHYFCWKQIEYTFEIINNIYRHATASRYSYENTFNSSSRGFFLIDSHEQTSRWSFFCPKLSLLVT